LACRNIAHSTDSAANESLSEIRGRVHRSSDLTAIPGLTGFAGVESCLFAGGRPVRSDFFRFRLFPHTAFSSLWHVGGDAELVAAALCTGEGIAPSMVRGAVNDRSPASGKPETLTLDSRDQGADWGGDSPRGGPPAIRQADVQSAWVDSGGTQFLMAFSGASMGRWKGLSVTS